MACLIHIERAWSVLESMHNGEYVYNLQIVSWYMHMICNVALECTQEYGLYKVYK